MTLLASASAYARKFNLFFASIGSIVAYGLIDPNSKNVVLSAADGNLTFNLPSGKSIVGANQLMRNTLELVSTSSPVTTNTITCNALGLDDIQYLTPAGTIAALTYVFPTDATSQLGQIIEITSNHIVSALTLTTTSLTIVGTSQTALAVNTPARWRKVKASTWLVLA